MKIARSPVILLILSMLIVIAIYVFLRPFSAPLPAYKIDIRQTSVSGVSSGGAMAVQIHVAHSSIMRGVGVTAGVAYDCADSSLPTKFQRVAQGLSCVAGSVSAAFSIARTAAAASAPGAIDDPATHLSRQKVWLFSGYNDGSVRRGAMNAMNGYYENYVDTGNVFYKTNNKAPHALVTDNYGGPCLGVSVDYINNCNYDSAGRLLEHIYGRLNPRSTSGLSSSILSFDQGEFVNGNPKSIGLADTGYAYVPMACQTETCRAHVVFHGCKQNAELVGNAVYDHAGYNEWADTNKLIVLYPQTVASNGTWPSGGPLNPRGCWDWWGYSAPAAHRRDYARKTGYQISAIKAMLDRLAAQFQPGGGSPDTFGTPQHLSGPDSTSTSIELVWQSNSAAAGFNIYRSDNSAAPYTKINTNPVIGASFADWGLNEGTTYHYKIRAIEQGSGLESAPTSPISVTTAPDPPACDPYFGNNVSYVLNLPPRAYALWINTYALGTNGSMGWYSSNVYTHLVKEGLVRYRVGYCP